MPRSTRSKAKKTPRPAPKNKKDVTPPAKRSKPDASTDAAVPSTRKLHRFMDAPPVDAAMPKLVDKLLEQKGKGSIKMFVRYMSDAASDGCTGPVKELHLHSKTEIDQLMLMNSAVKEGGGCCRMWRLYATRTLVLRR